MVTIRNATTQDATEISRLIQELADYEKMPGETELTPSDIQRDGFGENPLFQCVIAELDGKVIGLAIFYYIFSTWKGRCLYLEDLIVSEEHRGKGAGAILFEHVAKIARDKDCARMMWQVLDWNEPAINFYKKYNTEFDGEWIDCTLRREQLKMIEN